jgi:Leucine-rich repeat (LRR) protein
VRGLVEGKANIDTAEPSAFIAIDIPPGDAPAVGDANKYCPLLDLPAVLLLEVSRTMDRPTRAAFRQVNSATAAAGTSVVKSVVVNSPKELMLALKTYRSVIKVTLKGSGYTDADIQGLPDSVRELTMPNSVAITPAAWKNLKGLIKLTLEKCSEPTPKPVPLPSSLLELSIFAEPNLYARGLEDLTKLIKLTLGSNACTDVLYLRGLPASLCELSLSGRSMITRGWKVLNTLTQLTKLTLEYMNVTEAVLQDLPTWLRELSLMGLTQPVAVHNLMQLKRSLPKLELLNLGWAVQSREELASALKACRDADMGTSCKLTVVKLELWGGSYSREDLQDIPSSLLELRVISSDFELPVGGLAHLNKLITLELNNVRVGVLCEDLPASIRELVVNGGGGTGLVSNLGRWPKLERFEACGSELGDAEAEKIAANKTLRSVKLSYNGITDWGAKKLATNTSIREIDLSYNKIYLLGEQHLRNSSISSIRLGVQNWPGISAVFSGFFQVKIPCLCQQLFVGKPFESEIRIQNSPRLL